MDYSLETTNGVMVIKLYGEMDHHSAKSAREEIDSAIALESPMILRLDLSSLSFCDSSGLGFIMGRYRRMEEIGGTLTLVDPAMPIMRILRLSGLDKLIRTETSKGVK